MSQYFCDTARHLVCVPYTEEGLHAMARDLHIDPCWYHRSAKHPHYDVPKQRIEEVAAQCTVVDRREILRIVKGERG